MAYLPQMAYRDGISKYKTVVFGGLDRNIGAGDGTLWDMQNMTGDYYPVIGNRKHRYTVGHYANPHGMFAHDGLYIAAGTKLYKDGNEVPGLSLQDNDKTFVALGAYIVIFPDKLYINTVDNTYGTMKKNVGMVPVKIQNGMYAGESAQANTITYVGGGSWDWNNYFKVGDGVEISGCVIHPANNKTSIIREISEDKKSLRFYENVFEISGSGDNEQIDLRINIPDLDFICENENRLWGCKGDTIYASKLGDIFNWNVFDGLSTDSYAVAVGSAGDFTACTSYLGYPIFFKEDQIYKVYGNKPANFQVMSSASLGVEKGSAKSLAVAGEVLFYLSRAGMVAYSGGTPSNIHHAFGEVRYRNAVAGSNGLKYYCTMEHDGENTLFVYDTRIGQWYKEDSTQASAFAWNEDLYLLSANGDLIMYEDARTIPEGAVAEADFDSSIEFGDFVETEGTRRGYIPNRKGTSKLQLRLELDPGAVVDVYIKYDNDEDWTHVKTLTAPANKKWSPYLPVIPRRSDHFKIRINAHGTWKLYSLVRENYVGSELF